MNKVMKIALIVFGLLLLINIAYLDYRYAVDNFENNKKLHESAIQLNQVQPGFTICGAECQKDIENKVATEVAKLAEEWEKKLVLPKQTTESSLANANNQQTTIVNEPKIVVIPIASSGETNAVSWVEVKPSEFYFDLTNYPGAKEVRFEAYLLADQGAAKVYARLYDSTNNRGVDYSDIQTNSGSYTRIQSSKTSIWRGNNKYIVQLKSENGTVAKIKDAKLVISYQ